MTTPNGEKDYCARIVHELIGHLGLHEPRLVGHDAGGMIALRTCDSSMTPRCGHHGYRHPRCPALGKVLANPYIWHFSFHSIPGLPERLARNHIRAYIDYFYDDSPPGLRRSLTPSVTPMCAVTAAQRR